MFLNTNKLSYYISKVKSLDGDCWIMVEKLYEIIAKIMGVPASEINDESSPETIESWDSFNSLLLADELESEFNI